MCPCRAVLLCGRREQQGCASVRGGDTERSCVSVSCPSVSISKLDVVWQDTQEPSTA